MRHVLTVALCTLVALSAGCSSSVPLKTKKSITIACAKWAASDYLQKLSEDFTHETGIKVVIEQTEWDFFYKAFFDHAGQFDLVGGDSQWLGRGAVQGYYTDLTSFVKKNGLQKSMTAASMAGYAEYPAGSQRYWAVPLMGDAMGFAYRKDLFEDPKEKENFRAKYGYELAVPQTWSQLADIGEFFYRPDKGFYGVNVWANKEYDGTTMGVDSLLWAWGASLGDPVTYRVRGILDSPQGVAALEMYKKLHRLGAPEWRDAYLQANEALAQGKVSMVMSYFAFFPMLLDPAKNPYAKVTGFFTAPSGPGGRFSSLGGQGLSIVSSSKKKEEALLFLEWFVREETQKKWAKLGGYSCNEVVLHSEEFLNATPYNKSVMESMSILKDFWVVPEYAELLKVSQHYWGVFLDSDTISAQQAMTSIAREWEAIFETAGYYKE